MIAGVSLTEAALLSPGEISDLYVYRRRYDDDQHRITRERGRCFD